MLTGAVEHVLDEPSIGLHQKDNDRLLKTLYKLRDLGNSVIVVEHDEEAIKAADFIIDIGPLAGVHGGKIVAKGNLYAQHTQQTHARRALCHRPDGREVLARKSKRRARWVFSRKH